VGVDFTLTESGLFYKNGAKKRICCYNRYAAGIYYVLRILFSGIQKKRATGEHLVGVGLKSTWGIKLCSWDIRQCLLLFIFTVASVIRCAPSINKVPE